MRPLAWAVLLGLAVVLAFLLSIRLGSEPLTTAEVLAALQGKGVVISLTDCYRKTDYGEPIVALKSYIMSPFSEEQYVDYVLESIWKARQRISESEREQ